MSFIYIIGGFILLICAIYVLDKREKLSLQKKRLNYYIKEIHQLNSQLDDMSMQLQQLEKPVSQISHISQKILKYLK